MDRLSVPMAGRQQHRMSQRKGKYAIMASRTAPGQMFLFPIDAPPVPVVAPTVATALSPQRAASVVPPALAATSAASLPLTDLPLTESSAEPPRSQPAGPRSAEPKSVKPQSTASKATEKPSLDQLKAQLARIQSRGRGEDLASEPRFSAGGTVLNQLLPFGGLRRGTIVQWVGESEHSGAASLATIAAAEIVDSELSGGKPLVIFDLQHAFYPPAAIALGIPTDRMVVVKKKGHHTHADMVWAIDQALRCDAVAAVWAELGPWLNDRDARRLQLAAETGGTVGLFVRPAAVRRRPSFADVSWYVSPYRHSSSPSSRRRLRVEVDRCRGGAEGATAMVEIHSQLIANAIDEYVAAQNLASQNKERVVAFQTPATTSLPIPTSLPLQSHHESKVAGDLVRRLADPTLAKRGSMDRKTRDQKIAS